MKSRMETGEVMMMKSILMLICFCSRMKTKEMRIKKMETNKTVNHRTFMFLQAMEPILFNNL
jgi:hypothetical protein